MARTFTEQLRQAVRDAKVTRYQISVVTGIQQSALRDSFLGNAVFH